eukprot:scaffold2434_cov278-Prasinococcus_capsulatus_cf.AAC.2
METRRRGTLRGHRGGAGAASWCAHADPRARRMRGLGRGVPHACGEEYSSLSSSPPPPSDDGHRRR